MTTLSSGSRPSTRSRRTCLLSTVTRTLRPCLPKSLNSLGFHAHAAKFTECYDLAANEMVSEGYISERKRTAQKSRADNLYAKLVAAAESLLEFAKRCKGRPNKDISALTGQIISLIERFRE